MSIHHSASSRADQYGASPRSAAAGSTTRTPRDGAPGLGAGASEIAVPPALCETTPRGRHQQRRERVQPAIVEAERGTGERERGGGVAAHVEDRRGDLRDALRVAGQHRVAAPARELDRRAQRLRVGHAPDALRRRRQQRLAHARLGEGDERQSGRAVRPSRALSRLRRMADRLRAVHAADDQAVGAVEHREQRRLAGGPGKSRELVEGGIAQVELGPRRLRELEQPVAEPPTAATLVATDVAAPFERREQPEQRRAGQPGRGAELGGGRRRAGRGDPVDQGERLLERRGARDGGLGGGLTGGGHRGRLIPDYGLMLP